MAPPAGWTSLAREEEEEERYDPQGPDEIMRAEAAARATELFFTTKERGSGLGLAICREAVERAGGTLQIDSHPGAGTRVSLRVPVS